jgi:hypothetical protein
MTTFSDFFRAATGRGAPSASASRRRGSANAHDGRRGEGGGLRRLRRRCCPVYGSGGRAAWPAEEGSGILHLRRVRLTDFVTFGEHLHVVAEILRSQIGTSSFGGSDA